MQRFLNKSATASPIIYNNAMVEYSGNSTKHHNSFDSLCFWLIDSGASCHVYTNKSLFSSKSPIQLKPMICLPNGTTCHPEFSGTIQISNYKTLHHVFYVPQFRFNLLSVSCLTKDTKLAVLFSHDNCYFQDQNSNQLLVLGVQKGNLYYLVQIQIPLNKCHSN